MENIGRKAMMKEDAGISISTRRNEIIGTIRDDAGNPVGEIGGIPDPDTPGQFLMVGLSVFPACRGMGIGSAAVGDFERVLRVLGFDKVVLEDASGGDFWEHLGYERTGGTIYGHPERVKHLGRSC